MPSSSSRTFFGAHVDDDGLHGDVRVYAGEAAGRRDGLREPLADVRLLEEGLPLEVRELDDVAVDDPEEPDARPGQEARRLGPQAAAAGDEDPGRPDAGLAGLADGAEEDLAGVAIVVRTRHRRASVAGLRFREGRPLAGFSPFAPAFLAASRRRMLMSQGVAGPLDAPGERAGPPQEASMSTTTPDYTVRTNYTDNLEEMRAAHKVLLEVPFTPSEPERGYNMTLAPHRPHDPDGDREAGHPADEGHLRRRARLRPLAPLERHRRRRRSGTTRRTRSSSPPGRSPGSPSTPAPGKSLVVTISPLTDIPIDCNVGGYFGPLLKFCGFDALEIQGKADREVDRLHRRADGRHPDRGGAPRAGRQPHLLPRSSRTCTPTAPTDLRNVSVVSAGKGADHSLIGCLNFSFYDATPQGDAPQAGRARRHRHRLPRQEAEGARRPRAGQSRAT